MELKKKKGRKWTHRLWTGCLLGIVFVAGGVVLSTMQTRAAAYDCKIQFKANSGDKIVSDTYKLNADGYVVFKSNGNLKTKAIKSTDKHCDLPNVKTIGFTRTGYHIVNNSATAYKNKKGNVFSEADKDTNKSNVVTTTKLNNGTKVKKATTFTLFPNWEPNTVTVTFDTNCPRFASVDPPTETQKFKYGVSGQAFTAWTEDHFYYKLLGWAWSKNATKADYPVKCNVTNGWIASHSGGGSGAVTLYAVWQPKVYKINLDNQNADTTGTTVYYEKFNTGVYSDNACTSALVSIAKPTRTGYSFIGYYTEPNGKGTKIIDYSGKFTEEATIVNVCSHSYNSQDYKLYAYWDEDRYGIEYIGCGEDGCETWGHLDDDYGRFNDGSCVRRETIFYSQPYRILSEIPIKSGYVFKEWNTKVDGTGQSFFPNEIFKGANALAERYTLLYAIWTPTFGAEDNPVDITYLRSYNSNVTDAWYECITPGTTDFSISTRNKTLLDCTIYKKTNIFGGKKEEGRFILTNYEEGSAKNRTFTLDGTEADSGNTYLVHVTQDSRSEYTIRIDQHVDYANIGSYSGAIWTRDANSAEPYKPYSTTQTVWVGDKTFVDHLISLVTRLPELRRHDEALEDLAGYLAECSVPQSKLFITAAEMLVTCVGDNEILAKTDEICKKAGIVDPYAYPAEYTHGIKLTYYIATDPVAGTESAQLEVERWDGPVLEGPAGYTGKWECVNCDN